MWSWLLTGLALISMLVITGRALKSRAWKYQLEQTGPTRQEGPLLSVIIPARNEDHCIAETIDSLVEQTYKNLEIIVVDDQSTDQTADIVRKNQDTRVTLIEGKPAPSEEWTGKCWAAVQGVRHATGSWFLFLDADMRLKPWLISRVVGEGLQPRELFSLLPGASFEGFWNRLILPLHGFLIFLGFPLDDVNNPDSDTALAAGGFILIHQALYEECGGHEAIRTSIAEDLQLAKQAKQFGASIRLLSTEGLDSTHYDGLRDLAKGITKHLLACPWPPGIVIPAVQFSFLTIFILPMAFPGFYQLAGAWIPWAIAVGIYHIIYAGIQRKLKHSPGYGFLAILAIVGYSLIGWYAVLQLWRHGGPRWKGRRIPS